MHSPVKRRVMLASVLKPVDDTRMYEKMALTLLATGRFTLAVAGAGTTVPHTPEIQFFPLGRFARISAGRLLAPLKVLLACHQVKPQILIVNTHELLTVALISRILFGSEIWYDVQENYYRNIRFGGTFPPLVRGIIAGMVRAKERALAQFFSGFFLAEQGYQCEFTFFGSRAVILENKVSRRQLAPRRRGPVFTFLFSGTLAPATGVFEAIKLVKAVRAKGAPVHLRIIGFSAQPAVRQALRNACNPSDFITLEGVDSLVPHNRILEAIALADAGIISYPPSPHTENAIPTKLYEYLGNQLPIVCTRHPVWSALVDRWQAGISIDFDRYEADVVWQQISHHNFYPTPPVNVFWEDEAQRFLDALR